MLGGFDASKLRGLEVLSLRKLKNLENPIYSIGVAVSIQLGSNLVNLEGSWCHDGGPWGFLEGTWGSLGGLLGRSWESLGALLGLSWAVLGPSWAVSGPSWAVLGPSWAVFGRFWGPLGPSWDDLWSLLGRFRPSLSRKGEKANILQKQMEN